MQDKNLQPSRKSTLRALHTFKKQDLVKSGFLCSLSNLVCGCSFGAVLDRHIPWVVLYCV